MKSSFKDLKLLAVAAVCIWLAVHFRAGLSQSKGEKDTSEFSLWGVIQRLLSQSLVKAHGVLTTGHVKAP